MLKFESESQERKKSIMDTLNHSIFKMDNFHKEEIAKMDKTEKAFRKMKDLEKTVLAHKLHLD